MLDNQSAEGADLKLQRSLSSIEEGIKKRHFSLRKHPYFKLVVVMTVVFPLVSIGALYAFEAGSGSGVDGLSNALIWYVKSVPFIGGGAAMPGTLGGKISGVLAHLLNFGLACSWLGLLGWRLISRSVLDVVVRELKNQIKEG